MLPLSVVFHETPCDSCGGHLRAAGVNNVLIKKDIFVYDDEFCTLHLFYSVLFIMIMIVII